MVGGSKYVKSHFPEVMTFFVAWAALAFGLALVAALAMAPDSPADIDPNTTGWFEVFRRRLPRGSLPMVLVELEDKTQFVGEVTYYDVAKVTADREVVLGPPLWRKGPDEAELTPLPAEDQWRRVVLPGSRILAVWVRYPESVKAGR
jgi:hypothetical protein